VAFETASFHAPSHPVGRAWLDVLRIGIGAVSLAGAVFVAVLLDIEGSFSFALLAAGLLAFALMMVLFGRGVTRRWLAFGRDLGFTPAARRPVLDFGTDRPVLHGRAGQHPARLRLILTRTRDEGREWLEVETDLLCEPQDPRTLAALARAAAQQLVPGAKVRVSEGRVALRAPFAPEGAPALVEGLSQVAEFLERQGA
jgi:hypothetical protein